jgi:serine/threonine-protein kinase
MANAPVLLGRRLAGKYVLEAHVGGGAMGEVYRARHVALDAPLAIKIMREEIARDPAFRERFLREARATSMLEHQNSVRVVDFGEEPDGLVYLAMEFLDGRDLLALIRQDWPLPDARIADLLVQALSAIGVAHGRGIIHRDLKPENIMVLAIPEDDGPRDLVKVCDFGIAKLTDPRAFSTASGKGPLTSSGAVVGTPEYMSPEQARGDVLDARSDIYSMGIILYQMLTGRVPFTAENALGVVLKQVIDIPTAPSAVVPGVNPRLEAICLRAMAKSPDGRYASAREMRGDLRASVSGGSGGSPSRPRFDSDPAILGTLPTARPGAPVSGTLPLVALEPSSGALPASPRSASSSSDGFAPRTETGGAELAIPSTKPFRRTAAAAALGALVLLAGGGYAALRARAPGTTDAVRAPTSAPSAPHRDLDLGGDGPPSFVSPLDAPRAAAAKEWPAPAPPGSTARPGALSAPPSGPPSALLAASASPEPSASAAPTVAPPASAAVTPPPAEYNPRGAFVALLDVRASNVSSESVSGVFRAQNGRLTICYQDALRIAGAPVGGKVELSITTDDHGKITFANPMMRELPSFVRCARATLIGQSVGKVEGPAEATQWLDLRPNG